MMRIRTTVRTNICTIERTFQPGLGEGPPGAPAGGRRVNGRNSARRLKKSAHET